MTTGFAEEMERNARDFINRLIEDGVLAKDLYGGDRNFKPWYSPPWMYEPIEGGVQRLFVGINPGGDPANQDETDASHICADPGSHSINGEYNRWLCEYWGAMTKSGTRKPNPHQTAAWLAFEAMYGADRWEDILIDTPTTNVCPLRTQWAGGIVDKVWESSKGWFKMLLHRVKPATIICNGNGGKSPWSALRELGMVEHCEFNRKVAGNAYLKRGTYASDGVNADVIGMPMLVRFATSRLYQELRNLHLN